MTDYERQADELEERSHKLGDEIAEVREDWERKQSADNVPGAQNPDTGLPPEANYTTSGDKPPDDDELPPPEPDETD
jgi:hypothetical protein